MTIRLNHKTHKYKVFADTHIAPNLVKINQIQLSKNTAQQTV